MKKFIFNLSVFLLIILVFNIVVFVFANDNYYKGYKDFPSKSYNTFIVADSHGLSIDRFAEAYQVYNFSASSDSYLDMKRKVNYLIENDYKVDTIYLTVDRHTLSPYRDQFNNSDKSIIYSSEINFSYIKEKYFKYYLPVFQVKVNPLFRIYLEDKAKLLYLEKNNIPNNMIWNQLPEEEKFKRSRERVSGQFPTKEKSERLEKTLLEIINLCKKNNIKLIGLKFPLSSPYLKILKNRNYGADSLFYSHGLKVLDYESIFTRKEKYFKDEDHLNFEGGKKFAKTLLSK